MSLLISKVFTYDVDAGNYTQAVEAADAQALEPATRQAINNFVIGCKQDGIWTAIKASCILAGARTLAGALVPLAGTAPTNFNFVSGDYNRKTGLVGNGSSKYLDSNRNNNTDPQNSQHMAVYASTAPTSPFVIPSYIGTGGDTNGSTTLGISSFGPDSIYIRHRSSSFAIRGANSASHTGLIGLNRPDSASVTIRSAFSSNSSPLVSQAPRNANYGIYRNFDLEITNSSSNARLAFYSIGESLDLALLDARVTALINAFAAAIP